MEKTYPLLDRIGLETEAPEYLLWVEGLREMGITRQFATSRAALEFDLALWRAAAKITEYIIIRELGVTAREALDMCVEQRPVLVCKDCNTEIEFPVKYIIAQ